MLSLIVSTIAYFVAAFFIKRQLDEMDIPKSTTRSVCIFVAAAALSYVAAAAVEWAFP
jgi:VIT1/CCC1 family predicted Fe2+/Mn2+ transporter